MSPNAPYKVDILPVPSNCHVFGGGRLGAKATTIAFATTGGRVRGP
jgi:hypothetical protein